jgi:hypothetical protein
MATISGRLHERLAKMGYEVRRPQRIWLGRAADSGDLWRWKAVDKRSGVAAIGCTENMDACLKMPQAELQRRIEHSTC